MVNYKIIRSRRKTAAIIVSVKGEVTVRAPLCASRAAIEAFVNAKQAWILEKLAEARRQQARTPSHQFKPGELFPFQGRFYPLELVERARPALELAGDVFRLAQDAQAGAARVFADWYRGQARGLLKARADFYAGIYGFCYQNLRITSARTRWGSCSSRGTLSFSWRAAALPPEILDYVVVHELCHFLQPNHSAAFWAEVEKILPDYRRRRKALAGWGQHTLWD